MVASNGAEEDEVASPGHKLGQIIGTALETQFGPNLERLVTDLGSDYYLDRRGPRPARPGKNNITWVDSKGSKHNLDYVIERGGTATRIGKPVAFVEVAWRRYTKHAINKAGELISTLIPLRESYETSCRAVGAVVSGEWTNGALERMRGQGILVANVDYPVVHTAFLTEGEVDIDILERADEHTKRALLARLDALTPAQMEAIGRRLFAGAGERFSRFLDSLRLAVSSAIVEVIVSSSFSASHGFGSVEEAIEFLGSVEPNREEAEFSAYVIEVRWSNGDHISGRFSDKGKALEYLQRNT